MSTTTNKTTITTHPAFILSSRPGTDIWRKPPSHNAFTAPTYPSPLPQYPLSRFQRARLSFTLPPASQLRQYDQAGLLLHLTKPGLAEGKDKWIKTGIEFYEGVPYVSTVGCDAWADWSVVKLWEKKDGNGEMRPGVTVEARRERDVLGKSLWVYRLGGGEGEGEKGGRDPLREVNWFFAEEEGWNVGVGGYVARPTEEGGDGLLEVEFGEGIEVEILEA